MSVIAVVAVAIVDVISHSGIHIAVMPISPAVDWYSAFYNVCCQIFCFVNALRICLVDDYCKFFDLFHNVINPYFINHTNNQWLTAGCSFFVDKTSLCSYYGVYHALRWASMTKIYVKYYTMKSNCICTFSVCNIKGQIFNSLRIFQVIFNGNCLIFARKISCGSAAIKQWERLWKTNFCEYAQLCCAFCWHFSHLRRATLCLLRQTTTAAVVRAELRAITAVKQTNLPFYPPRGRQRRVGYRRAVGFG